MGKRGSVRGRGDASGMGKPSTIGEDPRTWCFWCARGCSVDACVRVAKGERRLTLAILIVGDLLVGLDVVLDVLRHARKGEAGSARCTSSSPPGGLA